MRGRPYTLVLNKIDALFTREQETRARNETDLAWLEAAWNGKYPPARSQHDEEYPHTQSRL